MHDARLLTVLFAGFAGMVWAQQDFEPDVVPTSAAAPRWGAGVKEWREEGGGKAEG